MEESNVNKSTSDFHTLSCDECDECSHRSFHITCVSSLSLSLSSTCYIMLYQVPVLEEIVYGRSAAHGIWLW